MSASAIGATTSTSASSGAIQGASAKELGQRFMSLLVAQMRNQDPLNPMDQAAMTGQLAQLSSLEQLSRIGDLIAAQGGSGAASGAGSGLSEAAAAIGKTARVALGSDGGLPSGGAQVSAHWDFDAPAPAVAQLIATDPSTGAQVGSWSLGAASGDINLGALPKGTQLSVQASTWSGAPDTKNSGIAKLSENVKVGSVLLVSGKPMISDGQGAKVPWASVIGLGA